MAEQYLHRAWYRTDVDPSDPAYEGAFSQSFPAESTERRIVSVDWSTPGEVQVTWLLRGQKRLLDPTRHDPAGAADGGAAS